MNCDCSHKIKRCLLLGRKTITNLDSIIKKQRHHFADKGPSSQSYVFSSSHIPCESWTIQKAEYERIDAFELWYWRRLLRVPWTSRSNQSLLKETNPEYLLEGLMLKLQWFGHLMWRANSVEKTVMLGRTEAGGEGDDRGWDGWMASLTQWTWVWVNPGVGDGQGGLACCSPWDCKDLDTTEWLNWTELKS